MFDAKHNDSTGTNSYQQTVIPEDIGGSYGLLAYPKNDSIARHTGEDAFIRQDNNPYNPPLNVEPLQVPQKSLVSSWIDQRRESSVLALSAELAIFTGVMSASIAWITTSAIKYTPADATKIAEVVISPVLALSFGVISFSSLLMATPPAVVLCARGLAWIRRSLTGGSS